MHYFIADRVRYYDKTKTPDRHDLKLGMVVVLDILSKPVDFGFKRSRLGLELWSGLLPADKKSYAVMRRVSHRI